MIKNKILILSSVWVEPNSSAAGTRMLQLIDLFKNQNFEIVYASTASKSAFAFDLLSLNITTYQIEINNPNFDDFLKDINPNFVLFDRFMVEEQLGWRVNSVLPNAFKILDTEDFHALRLARQIALKINENYIEILKKSDAAKREIASIYRSDLTLIISDFEINLLYSEFNIPRNLLFYLPLFTNQNHLVLPKFSQRKDFVFIGNFYHEPNFDSVIYLKKEVWPILKQKTKASLQIYGAYPTQKVLQLHNPKERFFINGRANSAFEVIANAKVLLSPLRFGAGIKGKLLEAMTYKTPSITTKIGAEGMQINENWNGFICNSINHIVENSVLLYENEAIWNKSVNFGTEIIEKKFKKEIYQTNFFNQLFKLHENLNNHRTNNFMGNLLQFHAYRSTEYLARWIETKNKL